MNRQTPALLILYKPLSQIKDEEYYELMFNSTNGLLIPGGAVSLTDSGKDFRLSSQARLFENCILRFKSFVKLLNHSQLYHFKVFKTIDQRKLLDFWTLCNKSGAFLSFSEYSSVFLYFMKAMLYLSFFFDAAQGFALEDIGYLIIFLISFVYSILCDLVKNNM